jgi:hypothetical protein
VGTHIADFLAIIGGPRAATARTLPVKGIVAVLSRFEGSPEQTVRDSAG